MRPLFILTARRDADPHAIADPRRGPADHARAGGDPTDRAQLAKALAASDSHGPSLLALDHVHHFLARSARAVDYRRTGHQYRAGRRGSTCWAAVGGRLALEE